MRYTILIAILSLMFFSSCEEDADVKLPEAKPQLVVNSFLSPQDTSIIVWVKLSRPIFESYDVNSNDAVQNATVVITDGAVSVTIPFNPAGVNGGNYSLDAISYPISQGKKYTLTVSTPDGKFASASTTVPVYFTPNLTASVQTSTVTAEYGGVESRTKIDYSFHDIAGNGSKYRFCIVRQLLTTFGDTVYQSYTSSYVTDEGRDALLLNDIIEFSEYSYSSGGATEQVIGYDLYLFHVNSDYYLYHKSLLNGQNGGDPFSEPSLIYSNIDGGLGAFCAFNYIDKVEIR